MAMGLVYSRPPQVGGSQFVDKLLDGRRDGFFVECGAFIGEEYSDTLFFELERNWTGILIEAHPDYHRAILTKNRRALVLRACLSAGRRPEYVRFRINGWGSGVSALNKNWKATDKQVRVAVLGTRVPIFEKLPIRSSSYQEPRSSLVFPTFLVNFS